jgi:dTDP-glucose pyrophosphorylase
MDNKRLIERSIDPASSILSALKKMDNLGVKSLIVIGGNNKFLGILSIGDIQRSIIQNISLEGPIISILRKNPKFARPNQQVDEIKDQMLRFRMEFMPVVSVNGEVTNIYFWEELFIEDQQIPYTQFSNPVVIMAGGLGTRLRPLTNVFPKPLMPYGQRTIIEEIMGRFARHGCSDFYVSVNFKSDLIKYYLEQQDLGYNLNYIRENKPLGTGGSLSLLKGRINTSFFVTNCDIIIDQDYNEILRYHIENKNEITIISALKHYPIPYGVLETGENGDLLHFQEKPEITFKINSGMYILESKVLNEIPENTFFPITEVINTIRNKGWKVGVFPVSEKSWKDIGSWDEYKRQLG